MVRLRILIMVTLKPSFLPSCIWLGQLQWGCLGEMSKQAKCVFMFAEFPVLSLQGVFSHFFLSTQQSLGIYVNMNTE